MKMDKLEYIASAKLGKLEFGILIGLGLFALGAAIDIREDDEYYFSCTVACGFVSFNVCYPKVLP